jgi:thiamine-phosphate pyrophosphorylase
MDYLFLGPIFDSISKENYTSRFPESLLYDLKDKGVINEKIIALGGINKENMHKVKDYGFGGVAILGALWENFPKQQDTEKLLTRFKEIQHAACQ